MEITKNDTGRLNEKLKEKEHCSKDPYGAGLLLIPVALFDNIVLKTANDVVAICSKLQRKPSSWTFL